MNSNESLSEGRFEFTRMTPETVCKVAEKEYNDTIIACEWVASAVAGVIAAVCAMSETGNKNPN